MKHIVTVDDQEKLMRWAAHKVDLVNGGWGEGAEAVGVAESATGKIVAVMVLNGFMDRMSFAHFATDGGRTWATPDVIRRVLGYPFLYKKLRRVVTFTPSDNVQMISMMLRLGFSMEGRVRQSPDGPEQDIMMSMFASECHWLDRHHSSGEGSSHG